MRGLCGPTIFVAVISLFVALALSRDLPDVVKLDLTPFFNAKAAATGPHDAFADFDGSGRAYPVEWLPFEPTFLFEGIEVRIGNSMTSLYHLLIWSWLSVRPPTFSQHCCP